MTDPVLVGLVGLAAFLLTCIAVGLTFDLDQFRRQARWIERREPLLQERQKRAYEDFCWATSREAEYRHAIELAILNAEPSLLDGLGVNLPRGDDLVRREPLLRIVDA